MAERVNILGVDVDAVTMAEAVDVVRRAMDTRAGVMVATANAEMLMRATHDEELRRILNASALVVPDGAGTVWAARHL
ncbi:MAG: glycosyltransferase, partial [Selenomonas sp.]|nr:glycosyltransferase [Selenomonas sp.]